MSAAVPTGRTPLQLQRYSVPLYLLFLALVTALSVWWVIFLGREGANYERFQLQHLETEQLHAAYLIRSVPESAGDPARTLGVAFPGLVFRATPEGPDVLIDPEVERTIRDEAHRRRRMFLWEGSFFLVLLLGGGTLVTLAYIREQRYRRTRELFLAGVSHEFKTPLASLLLYTETLGREGLDAAERGGILGHMGEDIARLRGMVEQVLAVSRAESPGLLRGDVFDLAEETEAVLRDLGPWIVREGAELTTELAPGCSIRGDRHALSVALRNLIVNAVQYSPAPARVSIRLEAGGRRHHLSVTDCGPGIPRSEHKRIFKSFYRVGEAGTRPRGAYGTGLGLFLVKRNVKAMGGRVELESREGEGAAFTLHLPALRGGDRRERKGGLA